MFKLCDGPCLVDKIIQTPLISLLVIAGKGADGLVRRPHGQIDGQILFNGDFVLQVGIMGQIGDTEPPLPEDLLNFIPMQPVARLQGTEKLFILHFFRFTVVDCPNREWGDAISR